MRSERGFTLIELLIVLAILGILVGVVAMSVGGLTGTATTRSMRAEMEVVQTAIDTYNTQDVAVEGDDALLAQADLVQVDADDTTTYPFAQYLKRDTKYFYKWDAGGENLVVCATDDGTNCLTYPGTPITITP